MITMLLGGLWHGANWTFVVWGALHGAYLWIEKIIQDIRKVPVPLATEGLVAMEGNPPALGKNKTFSNFMLAMVTFFFINVTWVFFRSPDFSSAWHLLSSMFSSVPKAEAYLTTLAIIKVSVIIVLLVAFHWMMRNTRVLVVAEKMPWWLLGIAWSVLLLLLIWSQESSSSFIYFQF
jgi:D-alanyl-lipoteichoic acid acyltransferase DltB (MBOAT superfamily)